MRQGEQRFELNSPKPIIVSAITAIFCFPIYLVFFYANIPHTLLYNTKEQKAILLINFFSLYSEAFKISIFFVLPLDNSNEMQYNKT